MKNLILILAFMFPLTLIGQGNVDDLISKGVQLHDAGKYDEAIDVYKKALKVDENSSLVNYEMGYSYYAKGDYKKAIKHFDKVIKNGKDHLQLSYVTKGSALDNLGKTKEAIKTYEKAIKKFPDEYLLHYNLALTQFNNKNSEAAEANLIQAIALNPAHSSSNYLLAIIKANQGKRVEGLLAVHFFLMSEPNSGRSVDGVKLLKNLMNDGVSQKEDNSIGITLNMSDDKDEFATANMMLSLMSAANMTEENENKTEQELFVENTESFFSILQEQKKGKKGIWWDIYIDFFSGLVDSGNIEAYCYYITQSNGEVENKWLSENETAMKKFADWINKE